jgi:transcriptional regulator with XRE-family HTH domain
MPSLDTLTGGCGDSGLAAKNADRLFEGFTGSHGEHRLQDSLRSYAQSSLCASGANFFAMETLGELVRKWRMDSGLSMAAMARRCGVKYQNIQQLENGTEQPRYLSELATAMGTSVDDLLALRMPPVLTDPAAKPSPVKRESQLSDRALKLARGFDAINAANVRASIYDSTMLAIERALDLQDSPPTQPDTMKRHGQGR